MEKAALRARMRAARKALAADERANQSVRVCARLLELPAVQTARIVALYWPIGDELDVRPALHSLAARGAQVALPVTLAGRRLAFVLADESLLARTAASVPADRTVPAWLAHPARPLDRLPAGLEPVDPGALDAVVVPGLAFDTDRRRLGYGGGYYDALLGGMRNMRKRPCTCGVGFDFQLLDTPLPAEAHDAALNCVVTPSQAIPTPLARRAPR